MVLYAHVSQFGIDVVLMRSKYQKPNVVFSMVLYTYVSQLGIDVALMCKSIKNTNVFLFNGFDSK